MLYSIYIYQHTIDRSNDGNTARRFFNDYKKSALITGLYENLVKKLAVILQVIPSGKNVRIERFWKIS